MSAFAVWLTGLPGSGKSAVARELAAELRARGVDVAVLESDVLRTQITPYPRYDEAERDLFYTSMLELGKTLVSHGKSVLFDATANRRRYRDAARGGIARFAEIYIDTPLEVCAARDPKRLYAGKKTTTLPGAQAPYEPPLAPELVLHGDRGTPRESAAAIRAWLERRGWLEPGRA